MEEWKPVIYLGIHTFYDISSYGRLRNREYNRILKLHKDTANYYHVSLYISGLRFVERIHVLVAQAFLPQPTRKLIVHHKDHNKENNNKTNLEYITESQNTIEYLKCKKVTLQLKMEKQKQQIDDIINMLNKK